MGTVWSALLVGGGLAGAIFVWLLRDTGKESDAEQKDAPLGEAAAPGGDQGGGGGLSPGPSRRELVTKPGILPSTSRGQICQGALKFTEGGQKPTWSFSRGPFPRTSLPCPGQDPPHAAPFPRLVRTRRAGPGGSLPHRPRAAPGCLCARRPPGGPVRPLGGGGDGPRRLAQCGRLQRRRPFRAFQRECLGSGGSYKPSSVSHRAGTLSQSQPHSLTFSHPSPLGRAGFGNTQAVSTSRYLDASVRKAKFRLDSGHEGLS